MTGPRSKIICRKPIEIAHSDGITVHFAETHDNPRLASRSQVYARMRTALCALFSDQGAYGFANGVEWYAAEKINVHDSPSLNWGAPVNQVDWIRRLNQLLKTHPVFHGPTETRMIQENSGNHVVLGCVAIFPAAEPCWWWSTWMIKTKPRPPGTRPPPAVRVRILSIFSARPT